MDTRKMSKTEEPKNESSSQGKQTTFFRELLTRRVPQFLGGYLAASWVIIEFIDWLVNRYPLSPFLVEFAMVALATLIPTVALIAYFHGKPGRDRWTKVEKIGIPTNLIISLVLLIFLFQGKELGATTTTVTVTSETGEQIERLIPKIEFRKKIALFPFENATGNGTNDWLSRALPVMTQFDIFQDMYINIISIYELYPDISKAGFDAQDRIPLTLMKKISGEHHMDYFISGKINEKDDQLSVTLSLYEQKTAKLLSENTLSSNDVLELADQMTVQLKNDLEIPLQHIETSEDLPVSEIMSSSIPALKLFFAGLDAISLEDNWLGGVELLEQSVQEDETFAFGYVHLYTYCLYSNQGQKVVQAFEPLMKHLYKLPERTQFGVKHDYYSMIKQDRAMALEVAKNWAELYPDDLQAHTVLALLYRVRNQTEMAVAEYKKILQLDPGKFDLLIDIGDLYKSAGELVKAESYYQQYLEEFPNNPKAYDELGDLKMLTGDYDEARANYEKALLIEPDNLSILLSLARIDTELGHFDDAQEKYDEALKASKSQKDFFNVYRGLEDFSQILGKQKQSIEYMELAYNEFVKYAPPLLVIDLKSESMGKYIRAGNTETAYQVLKETKAQMLAPPMDKLISYLDLDYYLEMEIADSAESNIALAKQAIEELQMGILRPTLMEAEGKLFELKKDYESAADKYEEWQQLDPTNANIHVHIGRCYRFIGDMKKAEEHISLALDIHPYDPEFHYEMALIHLESGNPDDARENLSIAEKIWADADSEFELAKSVKNKLSELGN